MKNLSLLVLMSIVGFTACIEDDFVDDFVEAELRITTLVDTIAEGDTFQLEANFLNNVGESEEVIIEWSSSDENIVSVDATGLVTANNAGSAIVTASYELDSVEYEDSIDVEVGATTVVSLQSLEGSIATTTFYDLEGDFVFTETADGGVTIEFGDDYKASAGLPGLFLYLSNNRNSIAAAREITEVTVFSGAHSYEIPDVGFSDYRYLLYFCKPFNVKVGDGEI